MDCIKQFVCLSIVLSGAMSTYAQAFALTKESMLQYKLAFPAEQRYPYAGHEGPVEISVPLTIVDSHSRTIADEIYLNATGWQSRFPITDTNAANHFVYAYESDPEGWGSDALDIISRCYFSVNDLTNALQVAERAIIANPENVSALAWAAQCSLYMADDHERTLRLWKELEVRAPSRECQRAMLIECIRAHDWDSAKHSVESMLASESTIDYCQAWLPLLYAVTTPDNESGIEVCNQLSEKCSAKNCQHSFEKSYRYKIGELFLLAAKRFEEERTMIRSLYNGLLSQMPQFDPNAFYLDAKKEEFQ